MPDQAATGGTGIHAHHACASPLEITSPLASADKADSCYSTAVSSSLFGACAGLGTKQHRRPSRAAASSSTREPTRAMTTAGVFCFGALSQRSAKRESNPREGRWETRRTSAHESQSKPGTEMVYPDWDCPSKTFIYPGVDCRSPDFFKGNLLETNAAPLEVWDPAIFMLLAFGAAKPKQGGLLAKSMGSAKQKDLSKNSIHFGCSSQLHVFSEKGNMSAHHCS